MSDVSTHWINKLVLAYPPISNQFATWVARDQSVKDYVSNSHLYMIGQRAEVFFENYDYKGTVLSFDLVGLEDTISGIKVDTEQFKHTKYAVESGSRAFRLLRDGHEQGEEPLEWFTVDKLLYEYWRGRIACEGLERFRTFTSYDLHYVGISNREDSLTRLFERGHTARADILSNEHTKRRSEPTRVTDELMIFLFDISDMGMRIIPPGADFENIDWSYNGPDKTQSFADAEKAFVHFLKAAYNKQQYNGYPVSRDGLYETGLTGYIVGIGEAIEFRTQHDTFWGNYSTDREELEDGDFIGVQGDKATLMKIATIPRA